MSAMKMMVFQGSRESQARYVALHLIQLDLRHISICSLVSCSVYNGLFETDLFSANYKVPSLFTETVLAHLLQSEVEGVDTEQLELCSAESVDGALAEHRTTWSISLSTAHSVNLTNSRSLDSS